MNKELSANMEDYLEAIAGLLKKNGVARVKDISRVLEVKSPSVNAALRTLSKKGLATHERYGYVNLTARGEKIARQIQKRHDTLMVFLTKILNIETSTAMKDACKMEHAMSPQTLQRLTQFIEFVDYCSVSQARGQESRFKEYISSGKVSFTRGLRKKIS